MATLKSTAQRYGTVAVSLHWLIAAFTVVLLFTGFRAAGEADTATKAQLLRIHIPVAIGALLLTAVRLLWWWRFDRKPLQVAGTSAFQMAIAQGVHVALQVVLVGMVASGLGMMILSGAGPAVFAGTTVSLPDFHDFLPRRPHGLGARLLVILVLIHVGAALYHHFIRRDGLLKRMW